MDGSADERRARWEAGWEARWERRRTRPVLFLPILVAAIQLIGSSLAQRGQPDATALDSLGYLLLAVGPLALTIRWRLPLVTLAVTLAATLAYLVEDYPRGPYFLAAVVALFGATRRASRPVVWAMTALAFALYPLLTDRPISEYVAVGAWTGMAVVLAELNRVRGNAMAQVRRAQTEAARARAEQSRRQASDERLRIARELHDVLGHHLSLINVRAGVALHLLDSQPEQAREALGAIKLASSEALREVRGVLATLQVQDESAPRAPAPGLSDIEQLAAQARAAGLPVTLRPEGEPSTVPGEVGRAAYRIVQEALTNVRRHAGSAATVTVVVAYGQSALEIRVDDTGVGPPELSTSEGNGIPGMRERAAALGGTLTAAAGPAGGFRVHAVLPLHPHGGG